MQYIGSCVIVMNKTFEYICNDTRKMYQKCIKNLYIKNIDDTIVYDDQNPQYSSCIINRNDFDKEFVNIFELLDDFYCKKKDSTLFLVLIINNHEDISDGIYYYNKRNQTLYRYRRSGSNEIIDNDNKTCHICCFLDVEKSVYKYEEAGLFYSSYEMGEFFSYMDNHINREVKVDLNIRNKQRKAHDLGINIYRQLYIGSLEIIF